MSWRRYEFFAPCEDGPVAVAHRGGPGDATGEPRPLDVFTRAAAIGVRFVEIDVRATAEGTLLVWHGRGLERLRPSRPLELGRLDPADVLPFEDVLESMPPDTRYFVDLKNRPAGDALARLVARTRCERRICVGSFSHARTLPAAAAIETATRYRPCTATTPRQAVGLLGRSALRPGSWNAPFASAQIPVWMARRRVLRSVHEGGALVFVWTVDEERSMRELLDRGADGIITDRPSRLVRVLEERRSGVVGGDPPAVR